MRAAPHVCLTLLAVLQATPATAQNPGDVATAAKAAADTLSSAAKDKLLVKDMLGAGVTGPDGQSIGTVENLVVVPGGRVVAVVVATNAKDTGRIPVPFSVVRLSRTAGKLGLTLPVGLSDLKGMKEVQALAGAIAIPGIR